MEKNVLCFAWYRIVFKDVIKLVTKDTHVIQPIYTQAMRFTTSRYIYGRLLTKVVLQVKWQLSEKVSSDMAIYKDTPVSNVINNKVEIESQTSLVTETVLARITITRKPRSKLETKATYVIFFPFV